MANELTPVTYKYQSLQIITGIHRNVCPLCVSCSLANWLMGPKRLTHPKHHNGQLIEPQVTQSNGNMSPMIDDTLASVIKQP